MVEFTPGMSQPKANPLQKYFRQPKIYINLPSNGAYYPPGSLEMTETGELPVFPMTAKDELTMKTPDALLNGQATVDLIKSCVPNIKDPWKMPSIDLDAVLIAIRIASYGETLDITTKIPRIGDERDYGVDLRLILNKLVSVQFENQIIVGDMAINIRPLTYEEFTKSSLKTFEEQRIFRLVNNTEIPEEEKLLKFNESFKKLTNLTVDMMIQSIYSIELEDDTVTDRQHISEFVQNSDKMFFSSVRKHLEGEKVKFQIEPLKIETTEEEQERGAPATFEVPITFDQSNFFA